MITRVPCGSRQTCRFAFPARKLTAQEIREFEEGGRLPNGTGRDPEVVKLEYQKPHDDQTQTIEGGAITQEAEGEYSAELPIDMDEDGTWQWRGRGTDADGTPFACTPPQSFEAYRTF